MNDFSSLLLTGLAVMVAGIALGYLLKAFIDRQSARGAKELTKNAKREADTIIKEARIAAKEELISSREQFEGETKERRQELKRIEERLDQREANIERKSDLLQNRIAEVDKREEAAYKQEQEVWKQEEGLRQKQEEIRGEKEKLAEMQATQEAELQRIATFTREEARELILGRLREEMEAERGALIRRLQEETRNSCEKEARKVMVNAMERYANECAYERTTATIALPNDEMKGRIIGREGRNIRAIEAVAGVSVLIDDTPEAVVISCFDPVRRAVARNAMERLVSDGRIHPTRIEEIVAKSQKEMEEEICKAGRDAVEELGLNNVPRNIVRMIGSLKYRFSYSQNVLKHSIESAYMMGSIAAQLGLNEKTARRAGLLHDIGKAVDHEVEGTHAQIGADILRRAGETEEIVNAVAAHHEEEDKITLLGVLVGVCDTLSASRPGARSESTELYLRRLEKLESIGGSMEGVEKCYAIQAGRELRVVVEPDNIDENRSAILAREIANEVEKQLQYPGQVKVTVMRETRAVEYAK